MKTCNKLELLRDLFSYELYILNKYFYYHSNIICIDRMKQTLKVIISNRCLIFLSTIHYLSDVGSTKTTAFNDKLFKNFRIKNNLILNYLIPN